MKPPLRFAAAISFAEVASRTLNFASGAGITGDLISCASLIAVTCH